MIRIIITITAIAAAAAGLFFVIHSSHEEEMKCDEVIFIEGELSRDIRGVDYLSDGNITRVHYCDSTIEDIPTIRVIKIVDKEDVQ